jgi:hypothetical protein
MARAGSTGAEPGTRARTVSGCLGALFRGALLVVGLYLAINMTAAPVRLAGVAAAAGGVALFGWRLRSALSEAAGTARTGRMASLLAGLGVMLTLSGFLTMQDMNHNWRLGSFVLFLAGLWLVLVGFLVYPPLERRSQQKPRRSAAAKALAALVLPATLLVITAGYVTTTTDYVWRYGRPVTAQGLTNCGYTKTTQGPAVMKISKPSCDAYWYVGGQKVTGRLHLEFAELTDPQPAHALGHQAVTRAGHPDDGSLLALGRIPYKWLLLLGVFAFLVVVLVASRPSRRAAPATT